MFSWGLIIAFVVIALFIILFIALGDGLLKEAAQAVGTDAEGYSAIPDSRRALFGGSKSKPNYVPSSDDFFHLTRGFDINLLGAAENEGGVVESVRSSTYSIKPIDFLGMAPIPKMMVEVGQRVKAGDALFFDKAQPEVMYAAPVSGEVIEVRRGEKRAIHEVVILADAAVEYATVQAPDLATVSREELVKFLANSGAWAFIRQRPYDVVANPNTTPKSIFISTFDTAPLAPNLEIALVGKEAEFAKGLEVLTKLTSGIVHLGLDARGDEPTAYAQFDVKGVVKHWFKGQHPAGNVGVHIHHIDPINAGEMIWYLDVQAVMLLGTLFTKGIYNTERLVAVTGVEVEKPRLVYAHQGISLASLGVSGKDGAVRVISGDVLTGTQVTDKSHLNFFDDQVTAIREGNYFEILGWLIPQKGHPTMSGTFPGGFFPDAQYEADTNTNGEHRAFVVSGQYESVLPMDIYPQYLFRAILANDFEQMEGLGILELSEEDVALCEYVCTSKQPLQQILRSGLDTMRAQES